MHNSLPDLYVSYPVLVASDDPALKPDLQHVKDARIMVVVDTRWPGTQTENSDQISAQLIEIVVEGGEYVAHVHFNCSTFNTYAGMDIPVFIGSVPASATSYVLIDEYTEGMDVMGRLHPDCIVVLEEAVQMTVHTSTDIKVSGTATGPTSGVYTLFGNVLAFADGYNVTVSGDGGGLLLNSFSGGGKGAYVVSPFVDGPSNLFNRPRGLRSLNGASGHVRILGVGGVEVAGVGDPFTVTLKVTS